MINNEASVIDATVDGANELGVLLVQAFSAESLEIVQVGRNLTGMRDQLIGGNDTDDFVVIRIVQHR